MAKRYRYVTYKREKHNNRIPIKNTFASKSLGYIPYLIRDEHFVMEGHKTRLKEQPHGQAPIRGIMN
jgi:hypothetical protein